MKFVWSIVIFALALGPYAARSSSAPIVPGGSGSGGLTEHEARLRRLSGYERMLSNLDRRAQLLIDDQMLALGRTPVSNAELARRALSVLNAVTEMHATQAESNLKSQRTPGKARSQGGTTAHSGSSEEISETLMDAIFMARYIAESVRGGRPLTAERLRVDLPYVLAHATDARERATVEENADRMAEERAKFDVSDADLQERLMQILERQFEFLAGAGREPLEAEVRIVKATVLNLIGVTGGHILLPFTMNAPSTNWQLKGGVTTVHSWPVESTNQGFRNHAAWTLYLNVLYLGGVVGLSAFLATRMPTEESAMLMLMASIVTTTWFWVKAIRGQNIERAVDGIRYLLWWNPGLKSVIHRLVARLRPHAELPKDKALQSRWFFDLWLHTERALAVITWRKRPAEGASSCEQRALGYKAISELD